MKARRSRMTGPVRQPTMLARVVEEIELVDRAPLRSLVPRREANSVMTPFAAPATRGQAHMLPIELVAVSAPVAAGYLFAASRRDVARSSSVAKGRTRTDQQE